MHKKFKILIPDVIAEPAEVEQGVFKNKAEIISCQADRLSDIPDNLWGESDAILAYDRIQYNSKLLSKLNKCKVIVRAGVGYDNVDIEYTKARGIVVCNVPDYGIEEVADHTMALILSLVRAIPEYSDNVKKRKWIRKNPITFRLRDKVLGIIGLGRIGSAMVSRAQCFGLKVIFYDPYIDRGYDKVFNAKQVNSLKELAKASDIISIHTPLTSETENMVDNKFFEYVKKGAILINTARGAIINIEDLKYAMRKNIIKACGLDVLPIEPPDGTQPLIVDYEKDKEWLRGRLIITPHSAFYSKEALDELRRKSAEEAKRVLEGKRPLNCVNNFYD